MSALRVINCRIVAAALKSTNVVTEIVAHRNGRFEIRSIEWAGYWSALISEDDADLSEQLVALQNSRAAFIRSRFDLAFARSYCFYYFSFLSTVIERIAGGMNNPALRSATLGIECFAIRRSEESSHLAVTGTSNVRNPVYLLSKLKCPKAYDDPKFLPLILCLDGHDFQSAVPRLFYYYRQFVLESRSNIAIFLYPAVQVEHRAEAFRCIDLVSHGLARKTAPRALGRAVWIADHTIGPFFRDKWMTMPQEASKAFAIADIGGGSGQLTECIWDRMVHHYPAMTAGRKLFWHLIDLKPHNIARLLRQKTVLANVAELRCFRADWKDWIAGNSTLTQRHHMVLLGRLLNNFSNFSVESVDDWFQIQLLSKGRISLREWKNRSYEPRKCLAESGPGASYLVASNARVKFGRIRAFAQLSLSDYFRGIHLLYQPTTNVGKDKVYFAARIFDDKCLLFSTGKSVLAALCAFSDLVVIEDIDFSAQALRRHMKVNNLSDLAASDATDRVKMQGTNLLCISERQHERFLPGRQIW